MHTFPSEYLYVDKDGSLYYKKYKTKKKSTFLTPYMLASTPVVFNKEATPMCFIKIIQSNPFLKNILFYADDFINEMQTITSNTNTNDSTLVFTWWELEYADKESFFMPKMEVFCTKGKNNEIMGIDFLNTATIKDYFIRINPNYDIYDENFQKIKSFIRYPTLFHVLYGFFWEISFFGNPCDRENESKKLKNIISKIKK